jgi:hypothetical protein
MANLEVLMDVVVFCFCSYKIIVGKSQYTPYTTHLAMGTVLAGAAGINKVGSEWSNPRVDGF